MPTIEFKIRYDKIADALYIKFKDDKVVDSDEVAPGVIVDYNQNGEVIGIEILEFSKQKLDLVELVTKGPGILVTEA